MLSTLTRKEIYFLHIPSANLSSFRSYLFLSPLHCMAASLTHPPLLPKHTDLAVRVSHKVPPSVLLLRMCHRFEEVRQLHAQFVVTGLLGHPLNAGRLIESYVQFSGINYAISVFETIPNPDIFAYNNIIRGLTLCKFQHEALLLFNRLLQEGQEPDSYTYTFVLKACSHLEILSEGEQAHCHIIKAGVAMGTHITSSLINMYTNADMIPCAERVLAELSQVKVDTFNSMISGYLKQGHLEKARKVFDNMSTRDVASWNAMISGFIKNGLHAEALEVFQEMMSTQVLADESTFVSSLTACAHLGTLDQGRWIHAYLDRNQVKISKILGAALIDMYAKCGCIEYGNELFEKMPERDVVTWGAIISGFARHGEVQKCFELFNEMVAGGTRPNEVVYASMLSACAHGGYIEMGYHYFSQMIRDYGITPSVEHYGCMVDLLCRAGKLTQAEELIQTMPLKPNSVIWGTFLNACRMYNDVKRGNWALGHLMDLEPQSGDRYKLAGLMFANAGVKEKAYEIRKFMKENSLTSRRGLSYVEVEGKVHEFVAGDIIHNDVREIYRLWGGLTD